jgi:metal-dependent amidase/aminoacylase/carboxypeptidase family protein
VVLGWARQGTARGDTWRASPTSGFTRTKPGAMLRPGVRSPGWSEPRPVHTPRFVLDESALPVGVAAMTSVALEYLATS